MDEGFASSDEDRVLIMPQRSMFVLPEGKKPPIMAVESQKPVKQMYRLTPSNLQQSILEDIKGKLKGNMDNFNSANTHSP